MQEQTFEMSQRSSLWRKGKVWITAVIIGSAVAGWFAYDMMVAPQWMRDFGLDMAARATIISGPSPDTVFSTMKGRPDPDSPYICFAQLAAFPWQRVHFVSSGALVPEELASLSWRGEGAGVHQKRLMQDERYQLIAFVDGGVVVEYGYYFTMWADLSALGRSQGFARDEAVFTAVSDESIYRLSVVDSVPSTACP